MKIKKVHAILLINATLVWAVNIINVKPIWPMPIAIISVVVTTSAVAMSVLALVFDRQQD